MGTTIRGIQAVVPSRRLGLEDVSARFGSEAADRIAKMTGIRERHVVSEGQTASDLAVEAARRLFEKAEVRPGDIDGVVFVTQTPDFIMPATSCMLQDRLGLPQHALAFDVNQGCSAYPYGLAVCHGLIAGEVASRVLLLVADTLSVNLSDKDKGTYPLFGDSATATVLERVGGPGDLLAFELGTDGSGWANIIVPVGQCRYPTVGEFRAHAPEELRKVPDPESISMDGNEVFAFTLRVVPEMVRTTLEKAQKTVDDTDYFFFHQANLFIINHLLKKTGLPAEKCPVSIDRYGNTSGPSPAVTACDALPRSGRRGELTVMFVGFGIGHSWASALVKLRAETVFQIEEV
ncbi:MAG: 3-oxoacyl-ACP synthase III family protein [Planctomycetota bacterium]